MISVDVIESFAEVDEELWADLWRTSRSPEVFTTLQWQRTWWSAFGRGELWIVQVRRGGAVVCIAPLFVDGEMAFEVGAGGSDYLDLVGPGVDAAVVAAILEAVRSKAPVGVRLYHLVDGSATVPAVAAAAAKVGWRLFEEDSMSAPFFRSSHDDEWQALIDKKSLVRHERGLRRDGDVIVEHHCGTDVSDLLDEFFAQHVERWRGTGSPSLFDDDAQRRFYRALAREAPPWLRFTRVVWNDRLVAAHLGFSHLGRYMWYKPTYDVAQARRSPGEVLIRHLLAAARSEGADEFDMGLGDEGFKSRFSNGVRTVRTWGAYPGA